MPFYEDFNLTEAQLLPALETALGEAVVRFALDADQEVKVGATDADKRLCTFRCVTARGVERDLRVFVKRCIWQDIHESIHYRYLASKGVPTARLYDALINDLGQEVVLLEVIGTVRFDDQNLAQWRSMLSLLAQFNACAISPAYAAHLHPYFLIGQIKQGWWLSGYPAQLNEEELAAILGGEGVSAEEVTVLLDAARNVFAEVAAQPQGLLHQDFNSGNFGWRHAEAGSGGDADAAVVFDLHKNGRGPRFSDVAPYLSELEWCDRSAAFLDTIDKAEQGSVRRRILLTDNYLAEYARSGGAVVPRETFVREVDALCRAHKITALPTLIERGDADGVAWVVNHLRELAALKAAGNG